MIDLLNEVGVDAMVLGNHEFDFTPAVTVARIAEAKFPILSNNAIKPDGTLLDGVTEHLLLEVDRYKVGVFGLTTAMTPEIRRPAPWRSAPRRRSRRSSPRCCASPGPTSSSPSPTPAMRRMQR